MSLSNYGDVHLFHRKFGLPHPKVPVLLDADTQDFRFKFMQEELEEFDNACVSGDLALAADALVDLVYVAMGTGVMMGLPWQALWDEVQRANISKVRAQSAEDPLSLRKHTLDVVKPPGWRPPDIAGVLKKYTELATLKGGPVQDGGNVDYRASMGPQDDEPSRFMRLSGGEGDPVVDFPISPKPFDR